MLNHFIQIVKIYYIYYYCIKLKKDEIMDNNQIKLLHHCTISQCQKIAEENCFDSLQFDLVGPTGTLHCRWLDAYYGMFVEIGKESNGFMTVNTFIMHDEIHCENLIIV